LLKGLQHATEKTPVTNLQLESFVAGIERDLYGRGEPEISSTDVGELIMAGLPKINEVAYVRFASVYRKFRDISSFERELTKIRESKEAKPPKKQAAK
jgi:transcriptional repressor NrdR